MELLAILIEALIGLVDLCLFGADIHAWFKGKPNRVERREARKAGEMQPARDQWNRRVVIFTFAFVIVTGLLVFLRFR